MFAMRADSAGMPSVGNPRLITRITIMTTNMNMVKPRRNHYRADNQCLSFYRCYHDTTTIISIMIIIIVISVVIVFVSSEFEKFPPRIPGS